MRKKFSDYKFEKSEMKIGIFENTNAEESDEWILSYTEKGRGEIA